MTPSPAMVVSLLALFVALSGSAVALQGRNKIDHDDLQSHVVHTAKIHDGAVNSAKVADSSLTGADVALNSIGGGRISNGSLTSVDLGPRSAGLGELDPAAFASPDIAPTASGGAFEIADNAIQGGEVSADTLTGADVSADTLTGFDVNEASLSVPKMGCQGGLVKGFALIDGDSSMPSTFTSSGTYVRSKTNCSGGTVEVRRFGTGDYQVRFNGIATMFALAVVQSGGDPNCVDNFVSITKDVGVPTEQVGLDVFDDDGDHQDNCHVVVAVI